MPFGLRNATQTFQRLMDRLFRHLPFVFTYLDDHLIASRTMEEHMKHLSQFFQVLQENGLTINPSKCTFASTSVKFLGHMVSESGIIPLQKHVSAVQEFPPPANLKQLQQFLGMVNFYRRFLPAIARTLKPLTDLLKGNPKHLVWSDSAATAFTAAKAALIAAVRLSHPAPDAVIALAVDASDSHVGAALQQLENHAWRPLAFFSKKLSPTECRYSTFDKELLAAYTAVRHFRFLLEGRPFRLLTDHKPLVAAMSRISPPWSARQQRQMSFLAEFTADFRHTPGSANVVADALSRPPSCASPAKTLSPVVRSPPPPPGSATSCDGTDINLTPPPPAAPPPDNPCQQIDFAAVAAAQADCPGVAMMRRSISLQVVTRPQQGRELYGDVSTGVFRPLLPSKFRPPAIAALHNVHHPGIRGYSPPSLSRFLLAGAAQRAHRLRQSLHGMSTRQNTPPCCPPAGPHRRSQPPVRTPAC
jgi:hypothetical protein